MNRNLFNKTKYYIKLAIKKPYLIFRFIFQHHLGVVLIVPIKNTFSLIKNEKIESIELTRDIDKIYTFYKNANRDSISLNQIEAWLERDFDCFLAYGYGEVPIAGMWIFKNEFKLARLSGKTLSSKNLIRLDNDTIYGAYVVVDKNYRGYGINQSMLGYIINHYSRNCQYKKILLITGANNGAYIHTAMKFHGMLVGITESYNILGLKIRKEIFIDIKEKVWNNF